MDADKKSTLGNITLNGEWNAMDESRDAFTATELIESYSGTKSIEIKLYRPFAKLRVVTTDIESLNNLGIEPTKATVTYSEKHYNAFNAFAGKAIADTKNRDIKHENFAIASYGENVAEGADMTLFTDYFFAENDVTQFTLEVFDQNGKLIKKNDFVTDIYVKRNYLTTIKGNILTDGNSFEVEIEDAFVNKDNPEDHPNYLGVYSGAYTETIKLKTGNYIFNGASVNTTIGPAIEIEENAVVTIYVQGNLDLVGATHGIYVPATSTLTIEGIASTRATAEKFGNINVVAKEGSAIGGGNITIQNIAGLTAKAADYKHAFGIGATDATVVIKNTKIDYVAGGYIQPLFVNDTQYGKNEPEGGAAIGGANITIEDSEIVKAEGGSKAAAIGNRFHSNTNITIKNSTLGDIFGGNASAAIGGSRYSEDISADNKQTININIDNSTITNAVGGQFAAGIGAGYDTHCKANDTNAVNHIVITNSNITVKGGKHGAGIGTGYHSAALTGSIDGESTINATAGESREKYTLAQNIGYGVVDATREFKNANITFTVNGVVIPSPVAYNNIVVVKNIDELQTALNNTKDGDNLIRFGANIAGVANIKQADKKNILLDGCGYEFDGTLYIHGNSRYTGAETLNIVNVNFKSDAAKWFIDSNSTAEAERYAHNVTIENCTFTSEAADNSVAVCGARFRQAYTVTFKGCKATNTFYMAWFTGCSNLTVDGCEVINNEEGITFGPCNNSVIRNSKIEADLYGVRYEATTQHAHDVTIENCELKGFIPVSVRNIKAGNNKPINVKVVGNNTLTKGGLYDVVFAANEYKSGVAPEVATGEWTITGHDNYTVFPYTWLVTNEAELQAAITNATAEFSKISFGADITGNAYIAQREGIDLVIDGCEYKFDGGFIVDGKNRSTGTDTVLFQNINFYTETTEELTFISCPGTYNGENERYSHNVTIDNCTFGAKELSENVGAINAQKTYHLKVTNCEATNLHSLLQVQSCDNDVTIENVTVNGCKSGISVGNTKETTITNAQIDVQKYGIRLDGAGERKVTVTIDGNSSIKAFAPIVARKVTEGCDVKIDLSNNTTLTRTGAGLYDVVVSSNKDYEDGNVTPTAPAGTWDVANAGSAKIFPEKMVAKVGNVEYGTFDEAIANWTNNTTLTLLDNVTLNDVITIKSTEHHILNLGTYTLTAASGKNAIEITPEGAGTAARSCLTINADATNPGGINAGSKACIKYSKTNGINDRLMVTINGGIYDGTISSSSNNGGQACPYFVFNGGVFNKAVNLSKAMLKVTGGVFHGMFSCTGDSTAYRLIAGGTFKTWTFMTADAANKFYVGTSKGVYDVGVYVNDDGYLVVGGPVITEFGDKFKAKATNATKWSSYLQYSSAAANGLYYTNADKAIEKHGEANVVLP